MIWTNEIYRSSLPRQLREKLRQESRRRQLDAWLECKAEAPTRGAGGLKKPLEGGWHIEYRLHEIRSDGSQLMEQDKIERSDAALQYAAVLFDIHYLQYFHRIAGTYPRPSPLVGS